MTASTFDRVADVIVSTIENEHPHDEKVVVTAESHIYDDLRIDSLDFLDIIFELDVEFNIKIPLEMWTQAANDGKWHETEYLVVGNLCTRIDELVAAKQAMEAASAE